MRLKQQRLIRPLALTATAAMMAMALALVWGTGAAFASTTTVNNSRSNSFKVGGKTLTAKSTAEFRTVNGKPAVLLSGGATLTEVELEKVKCNSVGAKAGEVKTEPLTAELGFINKAKGEVGLEERPTSGT